MKKHLFFIIYSIILIVGALLSALGTFVFPKDLSDKEILDEILKTLIAKNIGLELNTGGLKYGLGFAHPHTDVLKHYKELGGEIITIGSDAHKPEHLAYDFSKVPSILKEAGFKYYTIFKNRTPEFIKL